MTRAWRGGVVVATSLAVLLALGGTAVAVVTGVLDPSFGDRGLARMDLGGTEEAYGVAVQRDGRIVSVGLHATPGPVVDFAVTRLNRNGTPDTSFGDGGAVQTDLGAIDFATSVAIQPDGRIVVGGWTFVVGTNYDFAVVRYESDGSLDTSFGDGGIVVTDVGWFEVGWAVAVQRDGKVVLSGWTVIGGSADLVAVRYLPDGLLDEGFGDGGIVRTDVGGNDLGTGLAILRDGRIVIGGSSYADDDDGDPVLVRYRPDGTLDRGFGDDGIATAEAGGSLDVAGLRVQPDGRIAMAGSMWVEGIGYAGAIVRFTSRGTIDTGFGDAGLTIVDLDTESTFFALTVQRDGGILAAGDYFGPDYDFLLVRVLPDGTLDPAFGDAGRIITDLGGSDEPFAIALQGERIIVAGSTDDGTADLAVIRYR